MIAVPCPHDVLTMLLNDSALLVHAGFTMPALRSITVPMMTEKPAACSGSTNDDATAAASVGPVTVLRSLVPMRTERTKWRLVRRLAGGIEAVQIGKLVAAIVAIPTPPIAMFWPNTDCEAVGPYLAG